MEKSSVANLYLNGLHGHVTDIRTSVNTANEVRLPSDWLALLKDEFQKPYIRTLKEFLIKEKKSGVKVYPPSGLIFNAFWQCSWESLRVVILGQDPYHGPGQAMGLCFSVPKGIPFPPSLKNIFQEIQNEYGIDREPPSGDLTCWANQGVLLLNTTLTVREHQPGSHRNQGWETFTDRVIQIINEQKRNVVFMLWGKDAQAKKMLISVDKHFILTAPHPSPLSAHRGFLGCGHFKTCNDYLARNGQMPIQWDCLWK